MPGGEWCSLWGYYWIKCPSVTLGLCPNVCSLTVSFVPFLLCLADAIILLKANGHLFLQAAPRAISTCLLTILYCLNSTLQALNYLSTPVQFFLFTPVPNPMLSMYCFWLLKCAADYHVHTSECLQVDEGNCQMKSWRTIFWAPVYSQSMMLKFYHRNKCWQKIQLGGLGAGRNNLCFFSSSKIMNCSQFSQLFYKKRSQNFSHFSSNNFFSLFLNHSKTLLPLDQFVKSSQFFSSCLNFFPLQIFLTNLKFSEWAQSWLELARSCTQTSWLPNIPTRQFVWLKRTAASKMHEYPGPKTIIWFILHFAWSTSVLMPFVMNIVAVHEFKKTKQKYKYICTFFKGFVSCLMLFGLTFVLKLFEKFPQRRESIWFKPTQVISKTLPNCTALQLTSLIF